MYSPKNKVYCISGLGADHRAFSGLVLPDAELIPLIWLSPLKNESISAYAARMAVAIPETQPVLMGVSFGGMMALEIAKHLPDATVILISSVKSRHEMPLWMRLCGALRLGGMTPAKRKEWTRWIQYYFLGVETTTDRQLCDEFRQHTDPVYLIWAIRQVLGWQNTWQPARCHHIHGDKDRMFPLRRIKSAHIIKGAGHFMIANRAAAISEIVTALLRTPASLPGSLTA